MDSVNRAADALDCNYWLPWYPGAAGETMVERCKHLASGWLRVAAREPVTEVVADPGEEQGAL